MVIIVGMVGTVGTVDWQHVHMWQGVCHYGPGWSPITHLKLCLLLNYNIKEQ